MQNQPMTKQIVAAAVEVIRKKKDYTKDWEVR
jgi:hypothetical protein